ncbi:DMT family transporter [Pseudomonas taiwanensis]|uniref:DMT family transporter n=1 Tax=Pseudomonas taiwanensis TaxID=470150 RepID=UPI0009DC378D|nr:DMT family transporter [Pseudomonas taiwanensis]
MNRSTFWSFALVVVTAIWGWSFVAKHDLQGIAASCLNSWLFLLGGGSLLPFAFSSLLRIGRKDWLVGVAAGVVLFVAFAFQTTGIQLTSPSNAGFITGLAVVFTPLILYFVSGEKTSSLQLVGAVIALVGLALLSVRGFEFHVGDVLILVCAVFFAAHIVVLSKGRFSGSPLAFAVIQLFTVGVLSLAWSVGAGEFTVPADVDSQMIVVLLAVLSTALAYAVQTKAQTVIPAQKVALILLAEPVFGGVFGYFLAGDRLTSVNLLGAALIVFGMLISELRSANQLKLLKFKAISGRRCVKNEQNAS